MHSHAGAWERVLRGRAFLVPTLRRGNAYGGVKLLASVILAGGLITAPCLHAQDVAPCEFKPGEGPEMVVISSGQFSMGSSHNQATKRETALPQHDVTIDTPFAIGRCEVTFDEYDFFAESTGREKPDDQGWGRASRPVINVSWQDAADYTQWLSERTGMVYRLPSEAEWEYVAKAGTTSAFSTGDCINTDQANYNGSVDFEGCGARTGIDRNMTLPVNELAPNPWGLQHIHGNVWEWTQDCWHESYVGAPADGGPWISGADCGLRVIRGGGWLDPPEVLRSSLRARDDKNSSAFSRGFRVARDL